MFSENAVDQLGRLFTACAVRKCDCIVHYYQLILPSGYMSPKYVTNRAAAVSCSDRSGDFMSPCRPRNGCGKSADTSRDQRSV